MEIKKNYIGIIEKKFSFVCKFKIVLFVLEKARFNSQTGTFIYCYC